MCVFRLRFAHFPSRSAAGARRGGGVSRAERCSRDSAGQAVPGLYARLFMVPKRTGGFRSILDLSPLNVFLRHIRFRMETTRSVRLSLMPGDWVTSLGFTDAYFHVLIHRSHRKWLRFAWHDQVFHFRALPFGLSQSPWIFTMVVRQLCAKVHSLGMRMRVYLDGWAIMSQVGRSVHSTRRRS